ncbi:chemotaxis protein CheA [Paenibacillus agricola]|uniref:chemotaxis protein CheA n=1 Tax=Paenibacillus agricola TaxID=2716264 RepID=UPI001FB7513F|nr:chemotaxis protein CheA [Paenibacillus agricola]
MDASYLLELTGVFLDEVEDQLPTMDQEILKLEQAGESEETIQSLFRAAHTLKGSSAAMGFEEMKQLTHEMEHILDEVRTHRLQVTNAMIKLLFKCMDYLRILKEEFVVGAGISTEISPIVNELQRFSVDLKDHPTEGKGAVQDSRLLCTGGLEVFLKVQEAQEQSLNVLDIHVGFAPDCQMKSARAYIIFNQLDSWGDVLQTVPSLEDLGEEEASSLEGVQFLLASQAEPSLVKTALLSIMDVADVRISPYLPPNVESITELAVSASVKPKGKQTVIEEGKRKTQTIRVDVERLELLMNLVGELVIDQTRISQVGNILHHRYTSDDNVEELGQISDHVSRVIGELQENVMKVRMHPIEQLFNRFPRMVRDLAQSLNKEMELVIEGKETGMDRTVIEEIGDPLIHLIRNAVDHGIESAEERKHNGKPPKDRLRITAAHEENQVVIMVEDDGAGIDPDQIRSSALRKGVISEEEQKKISVQEAINLIFRPGFSTASSVSDVSGRGVGMDIVRDHIEKLSGVIVIETKLGEGTRFKIKLPLTLAIITGLLIKLNGRTFILRMSSVVEIVRMPLEAIQTIKGGLRGGDSGTGLASRLAFTIISIFRGCSRKRNSCRLSLSARRKNASLCSSTT